MKRTLSTQIALMSILLIVAGCGKPSKPVNRGDKEKPQPVSSEKPQVGRMPRFSDATLQLEWYKGTPQTVRRQIFNDKVPSGKIVEGLSVSGTRDKEKDVYVRWEFVGPSGIRGGDVYIFLLQDNERPGNNWTKTVIFKGEELVVNESNDVKVILNRKPLNEDTSPPAGAD